MLEPGNLMGEKRTISLCIFPEPKRYDLSQLLENRR